MGFGHGLQHYGIPGTVESKRDFGNKLAGHLDCLQLRRYRFDCTVIIENTSYELVFLQWSNIKGLTP